MTGKIAIWTDRAKAQLRAIDQQTALRILRTLARYLATLDGDVKRLQGTDPPEFRLRVGDYRLFFQEKEDGIEVMAVKHRREDYR